MFIPCILLLVHSLKVVGRELLVQSIVDSDQTA